MKRSETYSYITMISRWKKHRHCWLMPTMLVVQTVIIRLTILVGVLDA